MNITIEELEKLEPGTFDVIDMRGETEIAHGAIPGSVAIPEQELLENPPENTGKKLIIDCSRGRVSVDRKNCVAVVMRHIVWKAVILAG